MLVGGNFFFFSNKTLEGKGERRSRTRVVVGRPPVEGGGPLVLDEPLGPRAGLRGPAAE